MKIKIFNQIPRFLISETGEVFNQKGKKIKTSVNKYGYERLSAIVGSRTDKTRKCVNLKVHRMVAETFIPNPMNLPTVNHKDGNKLNNHVENLEWLSVGDNLRDGLKKGIIKKRKPTLEVMSKFRQGWRKWYLNGGKEKLQKNLKQYKN